MLRSVCFLLLLLFSLSSSHDGKQLVLAEDELQDGSSLDCGGEPSCYRKGDPYNSNGSTIGSEIQTSRLLLMADLNGAASRGVLFPSISYSQSRTLPSPIILSPAQNMLKNSKLASSANRSASVVESPSVFSGNLQNKGSNWPLSWAINTPQFCSLSPPSLAVQPSVHPPTHKHFFSKLVLDHMSHLGTPKYCVPPVFLQGINSRSLIRRAHVHNVPPFRSSHQEANHNGAPYFLISPSSLTTGKMKPIEAAFSAYDSVRSGASLPLTHYRQSQESLRFGKYTRSVLPSYALPVFAPSLVPMHYGQPQDPPSQRVQAPENQPSVRLLPPSNGWPLKALSPVASDGEPARGPFLNENQPPKALPPTLASLGPPTVTSPHLLSPDAEQYQMHPSAFHPVMPNPSNHTKWLSPRVLGTPSQLQPPVEHTRTSVSPSGPVASPPRILPNETSRTESSMPIRALPRTRSRRQAPIAAPYNNQEPFSSPPASIPSQSLPKNPRTAELAPSIKFVSPPYQQGLRGSVSSPHASPPFESPPGNAGTPAFTPPFKGTISSPTSLPSEPPEAAPSIIFPSHEHHHNMRASFVSSPSIFPSEPLLKKPSIPFAAWPKNISKGQAPVALAPKIQGHVIPPVRQPSRSPMEYPERPESAPSIAFNSPQYSRDENVQGPVASSPSIFPSVPRQKKPSIPVAAQPRNRNPVALAPKNQVPVTPISLPSKAPVEYPGTPEEAPLIRFHFPPRNRTGKGPASPPRLSPSISHRPRSIIPVANQPRKGSWRHSPAITAPIIQGSVSSPLITPPPEQPNSRTIIAPSIVFPSPSHYPRVKGHLTPPGNAPSEPPQKKLRTPVAPPPRIRSWSHAPAVIPPTSQGPSSPPHEHYRRYSGVPPFPPSITFPSPPYHQRMEGPVSAPTSIASSKAPKKTPNVPLAAPPSKRSWSHAPSAIPPINQGPVASAPMMFPSVPAQQKPTVQVAAPPSKRSSEHAPVASPLMAEGPVYSPVNRPLPSPSGNLRPPAVSPSIRFRSPTYHRHVKGPSASSAPAPSKISPTHHYWGMKGPFASTPRMVPSADSAPPQKKPSIPMAAPPSKRSLEHAPVASPLMAEGPVYSPVNRPLPLPSGNLRPPAVSPSIRFRSPKYHRHVKGPSASSAPEPSKISPTHHYWGMKGPFASTPRMVPSADSAPPQKKPSIPMAAPPSKRSLEHAPVASPLMAEGPVYSPVNRPLPLPSGNLRPPAVSPSIRFRSPTYHRHVKGSSASSAPAPSKISPTPHHYWGMKGPVASTPRMVPSADSAPPQKKPSIPMEAPPGKSSSKHAPVSSPTMGEGPIYSPVNHPLLSPSGNLRPPAVSPSIGFHSPPHHRHVKGPSVSSAPEPSRISPTPHHYWGTKGPVASTPKMIPSAPLQKKPSIPMAAPPSKSSSKHTPVASPTMGEGPVYSSVNHPLLSPSGNLRPPTISPSIGFRSPPHHRHVKGPVYSPANCPLVSPSGNLSPPAVSPSIMFPSPPNHQHVKGPSASPANIAPSESPHMTRRIPLAPPPLVFPPPPPSQGPVYSSVNHPLLSPSGNLRPPTISPSIGFRSPPHHRHVKGNLSPPAVSPSIMFPSPPNHQHVKGPSASPANIAPSESPHMTRRIPLAPPPLVFPPPPPSQGPVYSSVNHPLLSPSGNLRPPTISPSIGFRSPPHHRHVKGNLSPPAVSPSIMFPSPPNHQHVKGPSASPANIAPSESPHMTRRIPLAPPPLVFPPPPPSQDCSSIVCTQPLTSTPPGAPCGCVYPMQVELELGVALYAFFPLVSELAAEIAAGTFLKQSQVRIMGANADTQDQEKTIVILDLVPLGEKFDNTTAFLIFERFWQKKVIINETLFSDYWVISVSYPGLPPPPPSAFSNANINGEPTNSSGPSKHEPLGVDINKRSKKMGAGIIAVVALSSAIGAVICVGAVLITLLKCKNRSRPVSVVVEPTLGSSAMKRSGGCGGSVLSGSMESSTSLSFASSMAPYTGSAKTITIAELERATDRFSSQNILGEGGFGRVYRGVLEDGTKVAVKVLTRDDQQGGREFIAEVEMLSRLHHRNLVKLIGICTEEHNRSLVYELIPNGSVESHLHGLDKERAPLDWDARIKIALGAARGLAYLHEDSSPRVIHRDFKASNILLEDDFTPKVSDFGLAKSASEEVSGHISTRVMGTFGYVAPEYAMTGHLLVKSDVYSYGVVLLELLTGRKPVDMSQPPGQENLVTWARPLLTSKEGLEALVDPALGSNLPFDNIARVAAIASMCVQPEVSHRPFMGEVVQALKLVCNDSDTSNGGGSGHFSQGGESNAHYTEVKDGSSQQWPQSIQYVPDDSSFVTIDYDSGPLQTQGLETERPLSASALLSTSGSLTRQFSGSFRRHSSSGPLRTNKSKKSWYGIRGLAGGSISEHGVTRHEDVHELWP